MDDKSLAEAKESDEGTEEKDPVHEQEAVDDKDSDDKMPSEDKEESPEGEEKESKTSSPEVKEPTEDEDNDEIKSSTEKEPPKKDNDRKRASPENDSDSFDVPEKRPKIDPEVEPTQTTEDITSTEKTEDPGDTENKDSVEDIAVDSKENNTSAKSESNNEKAPSDSEKTQTDIPYLNGGDDISSSKSGSDSEKENRGGGTDSPNVNRKSKSDVITLSDESEEDSGKLMEDSFLDEITPEEIKLRRKIVKRLQGELRNEEAKLVLLKKLRQSQLSHQMQDSTTERPKSNTVRHPGAPPPLVRGQQESTPTLKLPQSSHNGHHSQALPHQSHNSQMQPRQSSHGPPPLVNMGPRMSNHQSMSQHHGMNRSIMQGQGHRGNMSHMMPGFRQSPVQPSPQHVPQRQEVEQTPAQRQAAAKLALRKQLEKTLLQIPPPKPPPPEMNFIPSLASPDFILLLGLEEVVNFIIDSQLIAKGQKNPDEKFVCNPFSCVQCGADFTPVWKREKPGSKNVICEHCVTSNQKKALKQEHTNRLKSAFVKALQQEQEIERMQAQSLNQPSPQTPSSHPSPATTAAAVPSAASPMGISSSSVMNLTSYKPSPEQLRQHQNFIQAHQAQLRAGSSLGLPFVQRGPSFPYQLPFTKPSDIQRQYFLDLLPRGGNMSWKS